MNIQNAVAPEKLYLLCGELLRDEGYEDVGRQEIAYLLGSALAFANIETSKDCLDDREMSEFVSDAVDHAHSFIKRFWEEAERHGLLAD